MDGEKNSAAFQAFYRINLTNGEIRMFFCIGLETGKITPFTAGLVHLEISGNIFSGTHPDCSGHVKISGSKESVVYIGIEGSFLSLIHI